MIVPTLKESNEPKDIETALKATMETLRDLAIFPPIVPPRKTRMQWTLTPLMSVLENSQIRIANTFVNTMDASIAINSDTWPKTVMSNSPPLHKTLKERVEHLSK